MDWFSESLQPAATVNPSSLSDPEISSIFYLEQSGLLWINFNTYHRSSNCEASVYSTATDQEKSSLLLADFTFDSLVSRDKISWQLVYKKTSSTLQVDDVTSNKKLILVQQSNFDWHLYHASCMARVWIDSGRPQRMKVRRSAECCAKSNEDFKHVYSSYRSCRCFCPHVTQSVLPFIKQNQNCCCAKFKPGLR